MSATGPRDPQDNRPTGAALMWTVAAVAAGTGYLAAVAQAPLAHAAVAVLGVALVVFLAVNAARRTAIAPAARERRPATWPDQGLRTIAAALGRAAALTDGQGIVRYVNPLMHELFATMKPGDPLSFGLRVPDVLDALERLLVSGGEARVEWSARVPAERWFEARLAAIAYPPRPDASAGRPDFVLVTVDELTERYRLERMRSDFVANASHELRTPLAAVSGFIETLQGPAKDDAQARERFLGIMSEQARRMRRLIDDLLSLSRAEMKAHLRPEQSVDLREVLARVTTTLGPLAAASRVDLRQTVPDAPLTVRGEGDELAQVFSNLIENAIKYGGEDKAVTLVCGTVPGPDGRALPSVTVTDEGPGIPPEHLPRLTERFYRVDVASSRSKQGTGLGLAIVKHILTRHRARLTIASPPGAGATFIVTFDE